MGSLILPPSQEVGGLLGAAGIFWGRSLLSTWGLWPAVAPISLVVVGSGQGVGFLREGGGVILYGIIVFQVCSVL